LLDWVDDLLDRVHLSNTNAVVHAVFDTPSSERELASIKVRKEDVDLIVRELEITEGKADRALREHNNDVVATLRTLLK